MDDQWVQAEDNYWSQEVQKTSGTLICEIARDKRTKKYVVKIKETTSLDTDASGLLIPDIETLSQAKEIGNELIAQFSKEQVPTTQFIMEPRNRS